MRKNVKGYFDKYKKFIHLDTDSATHINADPDPETRNCVQLTKSFRSEDVDLIYRKSSAHQLETPPDLELFLITLDRSQAFTHSSSHRFLGCQF
jgi:hypothetical protein